MKNRGYKLRSAGRVATLSLAKDDAIKLSFVRKHNEQMLMENILQNVNASFDNFLGFKLGLHILVKITFVTFSNTI